MDQPNAVLLKLLEASVKHQEFVEERLLAMQLTVNETNTRIIKLESAGIETRLQRLSERLTLLETDKSQRDGSSRLLDKLPNWGGWLLATGLCLWEYLRVTAR